MHLQNQESCELQVKNGGPDMEHSFMREATQWPGVHGLNAWQKSMPLSKAECYRGQFFGHKSKGGNPGQQSGIFRWLVNIFSVDRISLPLAGFILCVTITGIDSLAADPWSEGQTFDAIRYEDQHGNIRILDSSVKNVIFLADMDAKDSLHAELQDAGQDWLDKHHAVVIADIHGMPYLVSVMFALPAMRDYSYVLHLIREAGPGDRFPKKPGQLTLIRLKDRKIDSIQILQSGKALFQELQSGNEQ